MTDIPNEPILPETDDQVDADLDVTVASGELELKISPKVAAANALLTAINDLAARFDRIVDRMAHDKRVQRAVILSLIFDIGLSAFTLYNNQTARHASHEAAIAGRANQQTIVASCVSGNQSRAEVIELWTKFLSTPAAIKTHGPTSSDPILTFVRTTYAPHDCVLLPNGTLKQPKS